MKMGKICISLKSMGLFSFLDAGLKYPENKQLGVDVVIPKYGLPFENSDRIAGVFLTHGHADAIGALLISWLKPRLPVLGLS